MKKLFGKQGRERYRDPAASRRAVVILFLPRIKPRHRAEVRDYVNKKLEFASNFAFSDPAPGFFYMFRHDEARHSLQRRPRKETCPFDSHLIRFPRGYERKSDAGHPRLAKGRSPQLQRIMDSGIARDFSGTLSRPFSFSFSLALSLARRDIRIQCKFLQVMQSQLPRRS